MEAFMEEALVEAKKALESGEVPVGCVFVFEDKIIARGGNLVSDTNNATRHAEFECMEQVLEFCTKNGLQHEEVFPLISVVVTVEPCIMCAASLHEFGVKEIIYGCENDRFGGKTVVDVGEIFDKDIPISGGVRADEAMDLLKEFYKGKNPSAPEDMECDNDDMSVPNLDDLEPASKETSQNIDENIDENPSTSTHNPSSQNENITTIADSAAESADAVSESEE